jgi:hypothetical protein
METHRDRRPRSRQGYAKIAPLNSSLSNRVGEINAADDIPSPKDLIEMLMWSRAPVPERDTTT